MNYSRKTTAKRKNTHFELEIAFALIILLSGVYVAYDLLDKPRGAHPLGQWLGIIGTAMMVMTEVLYSLRKRTRLLNRFGPLRWWLSFHIVTGLVGPFLVLMHTGLAFRGLAGFTMILTGIIVFSGFLGRYLFTKINHPHETDNLILTRRLFSLWHTIHIPLGATLFVSVALHIAAAIYFRAGVFQP